MAVINARTRYGTGKGVARKLRREGALPAVLYGAGQANINLSLNAKEWEDLLAREKSGLRTHPQELVIDGSNRNMVMMRGYQVHPLSGLAEHVDFVRFDPNHEIEIAIPIHLVGEDKCPGVKAGGILQIIHRELDIACLAGNVPDYIEVSVAKLDIGHSIHIQDVKLPDGVEARGEEDMTIVTVVAVRAEVVDEGAAG
ncbi:50S ribosomal protein L25/general stress protein Ctc [Candidatus Magnetaquicoccus inordinatus]|uniref:50S ribosomal protein L25/general stress protein Ctc n=1 Tax=Candidatus Magnetaquicoccus inordinatus TaxID=2496818 RepID=UPI00102BC53E|nr:50S ribosomal protein L25/general stress protein Ctc [Candidatus Magnetaquicoccus inordinatus]